MPQDRISPLWQQHVQNLVNAHRAKGNEPVIEAVLPAQEPFGPRYKLRGHDQPFLRMNANSYLGLSRHPALVNAEEAAIQQFGVGPGAVRFISGTYAPHQDLELALAQFHGREAAMVFSSAYASIMSSVVALTTPETALISDELNHNCIINATRLAKAKNKWVYPHLNEAALENALQEASQSCARALVITDGVFSMRGVHAPLQSIASIVQRYDASFAENALLVVDDSHGVGAFGASGRGTEEVCQQVADVLVGTLGKAFGVNGGYVVGSQSLIAYLRETAAMYIYSNPITAGEAAAALAAVRLLQSPEGQSRLSQLHHNTLQFRQGIAALGYESFAGQHPVVPLVLRNAELTARMVQHLRIHGILATAIVYPVVPIGQESIRFQLSAEHTPADINYVLQVLGQFEKEPLSQHQT